MTSSRRSFLTFNWLWVNWEGAFLMNISSRNILMKQFLIFSLKREMRRVAREYSGTDLLTVAQSYGNLKLIKARSTTYWLSFSVFREIDSSRASSQGEQETLRRSFTSVGCQNERRQRRDPKNIDRGILITSSKKTEVNASNLIGDSQQLPHKQARAIRGWVRRPRCSRVRPAPTDAGNIFPLPALAVRFIEALYIFIVQMYRTLFDVYLTD